MSKHLRIKFKSFAQFNDEVLQAMQDLDKGHKEHIQDKSDAKNIIYFESQTSFQKFFSSQKIELLAIIKHAKPSTIYELAGIAHRSFSAVLKDVRGLRDYGFIELIRNEDNRKSYRPQLAFNYDMISIDIPIMGYRVSLAA